MSVKKELSVIFLGVLFLVFCGEGIQNSVLGSVWPAAYTDLGVALSVVGYAQMVKSIGKMTGSFCNDWLMRRLGIFKVTVLGLALITVALAGYGCSKSFLVLCICSIPMGFGDGLLSSALNTFAALHLTTKHSNWLNMFWSLGNTLGPYIMSFCMLHGLNWNKGFGVLAWITAVVLVILLLSYKYWEQLGAASAAVPAEQKEDKTEVKAYKLKYMPIMFLTLFCYIAVENMSALWGSSYISAQKGFAEDVAALGTTFLFLGMTVGRFLAGFISDKLGDRKMMYLGQILITLGGLCLALTSGKTTVLLSAAILGLGCAPIFPCFMHYLPEIFGSENTGAAVGFIIGLVQVSCIALPVVFGWVADLGGMWVYPYMLVFFALLMMALLIYQKKLVDSVEFNQL